MKSLILIISIFVCVFSQEIINDNFHGYIFSADYNLESILDSSDRIDLTSKNVEKAENLVSAFIKTENASIYRKISNYKRQYFGYQNTDGEKIIFINFITLDNPRERSWKRDYYIVFDGGDYYFAMTVNIDTGECFINWINGDA